MYLGKVLSQYNLTAAEEPFFMLCKTVRN